MSKAHPPHDLHGTSFHFFADSYRTARGLFLAAALDSGAVLSSWVLPDAAADDGGPLVCDVACMGDPSATRVLLLISGTHGAEGYAGSAVQAAWLRGSRRSLVPKNLKVVLIHALNPWGFAHKTRTTERGVDLNRNFIDFDAPLPVNEAFAQLGGLFTNSTWCVRTLLANYRRLQRELAQGSANRGAELVRGQYQRADAPYFGGSRPSWSRGVLEAVLASEAGNAAAVCAIDLHTGLGMHGEEVYLCFAPADSPGHALAGRWWGEENLKAAADAFMGAGVPNYRGLLIQAIPRLLNPACIFVGLVLEFGVGDDFAVFRADSLDCFLNDHAMEAHHRRSLRDEYWKTYCPDSIAWRENVVHAGPEAVNSALLGLAMLDA